MQSRIQELLQSPAGDMWCGTFHGLAHRTLKRFHKEAGLVSGFTILDSDDQLRIIKRLAKEAGLDDGAWPPKQMQWQINSWKDEGIRADKVNDKVRLLSKNSWVILDQNFIFPIGRRKIFKRDKISKWSIGSDYSDMDGIFISRSSILKCPSPL